MQKVSVPYEHDPQDLGQIWLAVSSGTPSERDWKAALRDTVDGQRVVWVKYPTPLPHGDVWIRDRNGITRSGNRVTAPVAANTSGPRVRGRTARRAGLR